MLLSPPRGFAPRLAIVAACAAGIRALYLATLGANIGGGGDWDFYYAQAGLIADGRGFLDPYMLAAGVEAPSAGHPPLYPLVLSALSLVGLDSPVAHRSLGVVLGAVTVVLVGLIARRLAGARAGIAAAAIAAVYPVFVGADGALMSEVLYGPLLAGALLAALALLRSPRVGPAAALGACIGLAALTRTEALLLLAALALPLAWRAAPTGRAARIGVAVAACVLAIAPWAIRNALTFERFVLISTNDATVLAGANCPAAYGGPGIGGWSFYCPSPRRLRDESLQAAVWRREGLDYARDHASRLPVVAAVRVLRVWDLWEPHRQARSIEGRHLRVAQAGTLAFFLLLPLGVAGAAAAAGRERFVLLVPFAVVTFVAATGYGTPRLRHAAEIPLVALAGVGAAAVMDRRRARSRAPAEAARGA